MNIKFKQLHPEAKLPAYAKPGDGAMDLYSVDEARIVDTSTTDFLEYRTGLAAEIPEGYVGLIFPRSSVSNLTLALANAVAVIDAGFRNEILLRFRYTRGADTTKYRKGERIGQLMIIQIPTITPAWAETLSESERGTGGFGSTGK